MNACRLLLLQVGGGGGHRRQLPHGEAQARDANRSDAQNLNTTN